VIDPLVLAPLRATLFGAREFLEWLGASARFLARLLIASPAALLRPGLISAQVYAAGAQSLVLVMTAGLFVGMVLGLQGYYTLSKFGAAASLGAVTVLALVRELGPVVTALLFAGRAGTALASEIGLMRATEQLSGMAMMATDPFKRVVVPRFLGCVISMPLLAAIFSVIGILGAYLVGVEVKGLDEGTFWSPMKTTVDYFDDVLGGVIKSAAFGVAAGMIAVREGYTAHPTAEGVSRATTRTVINTALAVLLLDFLLTAMLLEE
jgi:phospholipid/cholesterol/gamma-HCH transport system permease protein